MGKHDVPEGVGLVILGGEVDDLDLQVGDLLHAENVVRGDLQDHLPAFVAELAIEGAIAEGEFGEVAREDDF